MRIVVELIAARVAGDEVWYHCSEHDCPRTGDPTLTAKAALASHFPQVWLQKAVIHSTSWRYQDDHIVLTYLGYSEEFEREMLPDRFPLANVKDPKDDPDSVAAHAIRHLAFLVREDPAPYRSKLHPATLKALTGVAPDVAGRHDLKGVA